MEDDNINPLTGAHSRFEANSRRQLAEAAVAAGATPISATPPPPQYAGELTPELTPNMLQRPDDRKPLADVTRLFKTQYPVCHPPFTTPLRTPSAIETLENPRNMFRCVFACHKTNASNISLDLRFLCGAKHQLTRPAALLSGLVRQPCRSRPEQEGILPKYYRGHRHSRPAAAEAITAQAIRILPAARRKQDHENPHELPVTDNLDMACMLWIQAAVELLTLSPTRHELVIESFCHS